MSWELNWGKANKEAAKGLRSEANRIALKEQFSDPTPRQKRKSGKLKRFGLKIYWRGFGYNRALEETCIWYSTDRDRQNAERLGSRIWYGLSEKIERVER